MKFTLITGNPHKVKEFEQILGFNLDHKEIDLTEIQSLDPKEVAEHKAREAYKILGSPAIVDDSGIVFNALNRLPGTLSKWFITELKSEAMAKLLDPFEDRSAYAFDVIALFDGENLEIFEGITEGRVPNSPQGAMDFGWDNIFIPKGETRTYSEMSDQEKNKISHRYKALIKLKEFLASQR